MGARVHSASEIYSSGGTYCTEKKLIDLHAHAGCLSDGGKTCFINPRMKEEKLYGLVSKYRGLFSAFGISEKELQTHGNDYFFENVSQRVEASNCLDSVVLLALDGYYSFDSPHVDFDNTDFMITNDYVASQVKKHSNLLWGASVHPFRQDFAAELKKAHDHGAVLVKLIPPIHGFHLTSTEEKFKARMMDFYRLLKDYNLPLLVHLDEEGTFTQHLEKKFRDYVGVLGVRSAIESGVTVIVAHAASRESIVDFSPGGKGTTYKDLLMLMEEPTYKGKLFADISALPSAGTRTDHLCKVMNDYRAQPERLLWGSDFPLNVWFMTPSLLLGPSCSKSGLWASPEEAYALHSTQHQWDRAIFLQKNMGATDAIFNSTRKFLVDRNLVRVNSSGRVQLRLLN